jgi:hypothetical protein
LVFFVLKNIFTGIDAKLDAQGNTPEMFQTLTGGIAEEAAKILRKVEETASVSNDEIENIVRIHVRNHGVFGAEQ